MVSLFKSNSQLGETISPSLPNILGKVSGRHRFILFDGAMDWHGSLRASRWSWTPEDDTGQELKQQSVVPLENWMGNDFEFDASKHNSIYTDDDPNTVRPNSIGVTMWKRIL